ncbi:glycosyltransferase family 2 protein [Thioclava sp. A2]|uniref:glycosyltransferase family 2 protein n=1 Tax=Thioclava sp. FCG-A2 TaxID=3080562 RepID=UPI00295557C1|nr:glycosyltransferase family 2 protein [Thioclava sp. A2]MDV7269626.1 glycosyltransferase family 2 protein [Thioclava sp. A2]
MTQVIRRQMACEASAGDAPALLDALSWSETVEGQPRTAFRAFFANPSSAAQIAQVEGTTIAELRDVSGSVMVVGHAPIGQEITIGLSTAPALPDQPAPDFAPTRITADAPEWDILEGRNCLFGQRLEETVETVLDWLSWHFDQHGATGAVILDRCPPDSDATREDDFDTALREGLETREIDMRVIVLSAPRPLGKPGFGPENHPFLAPDAPGKDRMEIPAPDEWRAPLGQGIVFEIVKWRFLAKARAIVTLDVTDILAPQGARENIFDACVASDSGVVLMIGRRVYPWRVREGQPARFADHICRQFDARRGMAKWGCAPEKAGLEATWRMVRVAYARPDLSAVHPFWRAMALRVPGRNASELAPKTSLVEDTALLNAAREIWGHKPIRPPVSKAKPAPKRAIEAGRTAIVTTMKNEGPFIMEWIAYHRAIGVDDFLIYTNDCTDGTDEMLDMLERKGICQHRANPWVPGGELKPQHAALQAAEGEPVIQNAGWAICMDVDEFINVKIGDGTLKALYTAMGEANMISLTWRLFGNCDVHDYEDRYLLDQFTTCAPEIARKPHQAWGFKTLFRNIDLYKKLGVHRPKGLIPDLWDQVKWLNGSGRPMPREMFRNGWRSTLETYGYDWVQLNHYAVRSAESFLVKRDRGRVNHVDRDQGMNYWFRMNHNAEEECSIQRMIPRLQAEWDRLMADPEIRAAHEYSVAAHRAKIAELRATENYEKFYAELCSEKFERLSRILHVFGSNVFNVGPSVIPEDLHTRDLPPDFFFTVEHAGEAEH